MAATIRVQVPDTEAQPVQTLASLSDSQFENLLHLILKSSPRMQMDDFSQQVQEDWVAESEGEADVSELIRMAIRATRALNTGVTREDVLDQLLKLSTVDKVSGENGAAEQLRARLIKLTDVETIRITAAANHFLISQPSAYMGVTFFSDIRPIFLSGATEKVTKASVLVHQMQLSVFSDGEQKNVFVSLDDRDLLDLRDALDKTVKRVSALHESESAAGRIVVPA